MINSAGVMACPEIRVGPGWELQFAANHLGHFARRGAAPGVRGRPPLQRHMERRDMVAARWIDEDGNGIDPTFKSPQQGAATQVWAATSPKLAGLGGPYLEDCDVTEAGRPRRAVPGGLRRRRAEQHRREGLGRARL